MTSFEQKVITAVKRIPKGKVRTYRAIAKQAGSQGAARAVGNIMNRYDERVTGKVPCHRVVRTDGVIGGFRWGTKKKIAMLKKEGISIVKGRIRR